MGSSCMEGKYGMSFHRQTLSHSHVKGKGAYSVVPVNLKFCTKEVLDELYVTCFKHFQNALLSFHFTVLS
jgi:hypothetical protein